MGTDFQTNRELNRIIGRVTKQSVIRKEQMKNLPLCILYGEFPEEIRETLRTELADRTGNSQAAELAMVPCAKDMETAVMTAAHHLQERIGNGELPGCKRLYIAFFFMADKLDTPDVQNCILVLPELMLRLGYKEEYEVCYYCIFDYEYMIEGKQYKKAIQDLLQNSGTCYPLGIFTHTWGVAAGERYMKAVQAIAMHIFLRCIREAVPNYAVFTLAYWKRDVLKNSIADYLIQSLEMQEKEQETENEYSDRIGKIIDRITDFPVKECREIFKHFPVCTDSLKKGRYSERELSELLYGSEDAFREFLTENAGEGREQEQVELFFREDVGNLYAVRNRLKGALQKYRNNQEEQLQEQRQNALLEQRVKVGTIPKLREILDAFEKGCWEYDGSRFLLECKVNCVKVLLDHIDSKQFADKLLVRENETRNQIGHLRLIQRESLSLKADSYTGKILKDIFKDMKSNMVWNREIWSEDYLRQIEEQLEKLYLQASEQIYQNQRLILAEYAMHLKELKSIDALGSYYATRMDTPKDNREAEFLYVGSIQSNISPGELQTLLRIHLPKVEIRSREWEPNTCLELLAVKEITDLSELYSIDDGR